MESVLTEYALGHSRPWTAAEYLELQELPAWPRLELIDGNLHLSPNAGVPHQRVAFRLARLIADALDARPSGSAPLEVLSPANVHLSDTSVLVPDIVVCEAGGQAVAVPAADALLVIEVESPSSRAMDRMIKADAYARAGIPLYWRIELRGPSAPVLCRYSADIGSAPGQPAPYTLDERAPSGSLVRVSLPGGARIEFDPAALAQ